MKNFKFVMNLAASLILLAIHSVSAMEIKVGSLIITKPTIRATVPTAKVAAGYLTIRNDGTEADRLIGGSVDFAAKLDVHEMKVSDGVMTMRPLTYGLEIPAGATVILKAGAEHLMFIKLAEPMVEGEIRKVTLRFEKAGEVEVMFTVGDLAGNHNHAGHSD